MNVCLQRHAARYIYVIPDGLKELMSDISREVLRSQPESIYTFIADYLDALIITRENARVAARLVQSLTEIAETTTDLLQRTGMDRGEADKVVGVIQRAFRKHIEERKLSEERPSEEVDEINMVSGVMDEAQVDPEKAELAAVIIQEAYKSFKVRKEREQELMKDMVDWRVAARSAIHLYRRTGVTHEEANRAATLIKAAYKGYYTRRLMKKIVDEERRLTEELEAEDELLISESERRLSEKISKGDTEEKYVRIDYDSVKPHVDFAEAEIIVAEEQLDSEISQRKMEAVEESTTSVIVKHNLNVILERATEEIESRTNDENIEGNLAEVVEPIPTHDAVDTSPIKSAEQLEVTEETQEEATATEPVPEPPNDEIEVKQSVEGAEQPEEKVDAQEEPLGDAGTEIQEPTTDEPPKDVPQGDAEVTVVEES